MPKNGLQFSSELEFVVLSTQSLEKLRKNSFFKKLEQSVDLKDESAFRFFIDLIENLTEIGRDSKSDSSPLIKILGIEDGRVEENRKFCIQDLMNKKEALLNQKVIHNSSLETLLTKYLHYKVSFILPNLWFLIEPPSLKLPKDIFVRLAQAQSALREIYRDRMALPVYRPYTLFEWVDVRSLPQNVLAGIVAEFQSATENSEGVIPKYMAEVINYFVKGIDGEAEILVRYPI